jgi:hypothetical protein
MSTIGCARMYDHSHEVKLVVLWWVTHLNFVHSLVVISSACLTLLFLALFLLFFFLI